MPTRDSKVIAFSSRPTAGPRRVEPSTAATEVPLHVLIVDDTPEDRMVVRLALESYGYLLSEVDTGERGLAAAKALQPDCILLDYHLPDLDGHEVLDALRRPDGAMPCAIVMLTGSSNGETAAKLLMAGALDYLGKQHLADDSLRRAVQGAVERYRLLEDHRRAEERNAQLAAIVESSADAIVSTGLDDRVQTWNSGAVALFGYAEQDAVGRTIEELIVPPHMVEQRRKLYDRVRRGRAAITFESERRRQDSSLVPVEINASPIFGTSGAVNGISVVFRDLTARKRAEQALKQSEAFAWAVYESSPDCVKIIDAAGNLERMNGNGQRCMEIDDFATVCGLRLPALWPPEESNKVEAALAEASEGRVGRFSGFCPTAKGAPRWWDVMITAIPDYDGGPKRLIASSRDVTQQRRYEANLAFLAELAQAMAPLQTCEEVAHIATQRIISHMSQLRCLLVEIDEAQDRAVVFHDHSDGGSPSLIGTYSISEFHTEQERAQLFEGRPIVIHDTLSECPAGVAERFAALGIGALVNIPHLHHGRCRFVLSLARAEPTEWRDDQVELLREVAARVYSRLERARAEQRLHERSRQLDLLAHTSQMLLLGREVERELLEPVFREIAEHLGAEMFYHYRLADEPRLLRLDAFGGITEEERRRFATIPFGELLCGRVAETRDRLIVEDLQHSTQPGSEVLHAAGATSYAGFPLVANGELAGTIAFVSRERVHFRDGEIQMVQTICDQIATSLERTRLTRELRESETRLRYCLEAAHAGTWDWDLRTGDIAWSPESYQLFDIDPDIGPLAHADRESRIHPDDRARSSAIVADAVSGVVPEFRAELRVVHRNGDIRWLLGIGQVKRADDGTALRMSGINLDITERKLAEERLRAARDTFRHLVERSPFGIYAIDADFRVFQVSEGAHKAFENVRPLIGRDLAEVLRIVWPEPFANEIIARFRHTLATGEHYASASANERRADIDATEAYDWKIERLTMPDGRFGVVCHFYDLSERKRHEEHIHLLMREINHRAKNMLGLVQAVARQTAATRPEDFLERFGQRIQALAANQDLLVASDWTSVDLGELVRSQLAHFGDAREMRVSLDGPTVEITASASQAVGMALNELATNAAKYGALSNETGRVAIRWDVHDAEDGSRFTMSWVESDGPPVANPTRRGFGSTVIGSMLKMSLGCESEIEFAPSGIVWRIDCQAEGVLEGHSVRNAARPNGHVGPEFAAREAGGRRILVVEDEALIALEISDALSTAGFDVIGPASTVAQAMALIAQLGCDAAVVDTNLGGVTAEPIAHELIRRATPFIVMSGYSREQQPEVMRCAPLLGKPLRPDRLIAEIKRCLLQTKPS